MSDGETELGDDRRVAFAAAVGTHSALNDGSATAAPRRLRIAFFMWTINFDRVFECALRELLDRGHSVRVLIDVKKSGMPPSATRLLDSLEVRYPAFSYEDPLCRWHPWMDIATALRHGIDLLRYMAPEYERADALRDRMAARTPRALRAIVGLGQRGHRWRRAIGHVLVALERAIPVPDDVIELIREQRPDVVLVAPVVGGGSPQVEYLRAAAALGIPSVLPVASWDNLTNKGVIKEEPTLTIVWNEAQVEEAVRLHGIRRERVLATGAHSFDHWFGWEPSTTREEFATKVGLDPARPFLLYVCSSGFIGRQEPEFIEEWVARLSASDNVLLREANVIVRPHPQNVAAWSDRKIGPVGQIAVWPRGGAAPTDDERKSDYYDSIYHASAVVGINTSAQVEAAIVGRPVFTIADERFRKTQEGTLHFAHLAGTSDDGMLVIAHSWDEHLEQLSAALARPDEHRARLDAFVRRFARPHGLDERAAPRLACAVERVASVSLPAPPPPGGLTLGLAAITPAITVLSRTRARQIAALRRLRRRWSRSSRRVRGKVRRVVRPWRPVAPAPETAASSERLPLG